MRHKVVQAFEQAAGEEARNVSKVRAFHSNDVLLVWANFSRRSSTRMKYGTSEGTCYSPRMLRPLPACICNVYYMYKVYSTKWCCVQCSKQCPSFGFGILLSAWQALPAYRSTTCIDALWSLHSFNCAIWCLHKSMLCSLHVEWSARPLTCPAVHSILKVTFQTDGQIETTLQLCIMGEGCYIDNMLLRACFFCLVLTPFFLNLYAHSESF